MGVFMEDRLIRVLRSWGTFFTVWPLNPETGKLKRLCCKCLWWFFTVNIINQNVLTINGIIHQRGFVNILKSMLETMYMFEIAFNIIYCGIRRKRMQVNVRFGTRSAITARGVSSSNSESFKNL